MALGILLPPWSSAWYTSAIFEIVISEKLGWNVEVDTAPISSSLEGMYNIMGCTTPSDGANRGCDQRNIKNRLMFESWHLGFPSAVQDLAEKYPAEMVIDAGSMGFDGAAGQYVSQTFLDAAWNTTGIALEYYKSYDARWNTPWTFYDDIDTLNLSKLLPCSRSLLGDNATMYELFLKTGDAAGVVATNNTYQAYCQDGHLWRAPFCRDTPSHCILYLSTSDGWGLSQCVQRSVAYNLPIAFGVAEWNDFVEIPKTFACFFYWWTPDDTFVELSPKQLIYPPTSAYEWSQGIFTTATQDLKVVKLGSYDLPFLAPDVIDLLAKAQLELSTVEELIKSARANASGLTPRHVVACNWLKHNSARWLDWIPKPTRCKVGYGLLNEALGDFTTSRAQATTCRACLPGMHSVPLIDGEGRTYICQPCPEGTHQLAAGAVVCDPCPLGTSKAEVSTAECQPCASGFYQDERGKETCKRCPNGTTTLLLGVREVFGCGCTEGTIDVSTNPSTTADCVSCSEGLLCPDMSTTDNLMSGSNSHGERYIPKILERYFSTISDPLAVFKCGSDIQCPGGVPGTCSGGLEGIPCGKCPANTFWINDTCTACGGWAAAGWILALIMLTGSLVMSYYLLNRDISARPSTVESTTSLIGMMINMLQSLGIIGTMTVEFPVSSAWIFSSLEIFTLDMDGLGFACLMGANPVTRYIATVLFFPAGLLWLLFCGTVSRVFPRWAWKTVRLRSIMGEFLQAAFATMSSIALMPMICYAHPNGQHSNLKYPVIFCGSSEHTAMLIAGSLLLAIGVCGFLALCSWLALKSPSFSTLGRYDLIQSSKFLLGRFRLDVWWWELPLLLRGPLLAMTVVLAPDAPALQVAGCQTILIVFSAAQAYHWPWKAPILNVVDFIVCFLLSIFVLTASFYVPAVTGPVFETFQALSLAILVCLIGVVLVLMLCAIFALLYRVASGSEMELAIMTVGRTPSPGIVSKALCTVNVALRASEPNVVDQRVAELGVYDHQLLLRSITILNSEVVDFDIRGEKSTLRVSSRALWAEAKPEPLVGAFARDISDISHTGTDEVASVVLEPALSEEDLITVDA